MRSLALNKLVRDGIVPEMLADGQQVVSRTLGDDEYLQALADKLVEEARDLDTSDPAEAVRELADVLEVTVALAARLGVNFDALRKIQTERKEKRGGFATHTFIERIDLADNDPWCAYYAKNPIKYPEITE